MSQQPPRPNKKAASEKDDQQTVIEFEDNHLLAQVVGEHDRYLARIEQGLEVSVTPRGNKLAIAGNADAQVMTRQVLEDLYERLQKGLDVTEAEVDAAIRMVRGGPASDGKRGSVAETGTMIVTKKRRITPRSSNQAYYVNSLQTHELVFGLGPAGTGKTYLAVAVAVSMLIQNQVDRIILARPAVEAGEKLGFLPGDMRDKIDPYLRPLYDALYDMLPAEEVVKRLENGEIEVAALAFMRGRTLANSAIILDEAQNTTPVQMKMLLTRMGENSRMAVTGDLSQVDLPLGVRSGLQEAVTILKGVKGVDFINFGETDVVRHPLVTRIVRAYGEHEREKKLNLKTKSG
ncbi:PhoH family protein [Sneathiella chinensis]|uniref:PhoH-like protein n=1 Tax=Sneathiella chinensis TaxID=349750 RepID=A0ABQ5U0M3_9PROT|nr:PhoH family protein [Sneathiella chinensis]GLQ05206.1 phosphate starvation protein PhoH [Sneathiella chinensis]